MDNKPAVHEADEETTEPQAPAKSVQDVESDDEDNPFHLFAMTQGSDGYGIPADVNPHLIARDIGRDEDGEDEDDGDAGERRHAEDARQRAQEGINFRATQAPHGDASDNEYDDADLDELFRQTVMPGVSTPRKGRDAYTPTSNGSWRTGPRSGASATPTSVGRELQARRAEREERMRREAGLGDLR